MSTYEAREISNQIIVNVCLGENLNNPHFSDETEENSARKELKADYNEGNQFFGVDFKAVCTEKFVKMWIQKELLFTESATAKFPNTIRALLVDVYLVDEPS